MVKGDGEGVFKTTKLDDPLMRWIISLPLHVRRELDGYVFTFLKPGREIN